MDDGTIIECKPGDVSLLLHGHDAWGSWQSAGSIFEEGYDSLSEYEKSLTESMD